jgi:hypothetical protein
MKKKNRNRTPVLDLVIIYLFYLSILIIIIYGALSLLEFGGN